MLNTSFPTAINSQITDSITQGFFKASHEELTIPNTWYYTYTRPCNSGRSEVEFEGEVKDGFKLLISLAGALKENVSVTYVSEDNLVRVKADIKVENYDKAYEGSFYVPYKFDVDEIECSLKNGLLTIFIPYDKESKPKEAKIS